MQSSDDYLRLAPCCKACGAPVPEGVRCSYCLTPLHELPMLTWYGNMTVISRKLYGVLIP